jgi:hypothetical protein
MGVWWLKLLWLKLLWLKLLWLKLLRWQFNARGIKVFHKRFDERSESVIGRTKYLNRIELGVYKPAEYILHIFQQRFYQSRQHFVRFKWFDFIHEYFVFLTLGFVVAGNATKRTASLNALRRCYSIDTPSNTRLRS